VAQKKKPKKPTPQQEIARLKKELAKRDKVISDLEKLSKWRKK
jgi:hypothetical protein